MKTVSIMSAAGVLAAALLSACAGPAPQAYNTSYNNPGALANNIGVIDAIELTHPTTGTSGGGAVVGGLIGALVGNQIGGGSGRTAATVAGAVGGAVVGNNVESNSQAQAGREMVQIAVRLPNGDVRLVVQASAADLRVGDRVRVVDGRVYRE